MGVGHRSYISGVDTIAAMAPARVRGNWQALRRLLAISAAAVLGPADRVAIDREAFTITRYQLEVQIDRTSHVMAVTGKLTSAQRFRQAAEEGRRSRYRRRSPGTTSCSTTSPAVAGRQLHLRHRPHRQPVRGDHHSAQRSAAGGDDHAGRAIRWNHYPGYDAADARRHARAHGRAQRLGPDQRSFTAVRGLGYVVVVSGGDVMRSA